MPSESEQILSKAKGVSLSLWLILFIAFIILLTLLLTSLRVHQERNQSIKKELGLRLLGIVRTGALMIDGDKHEEIVSPEDMELPEFLEIQSILNRIKESNNLDSPIYTLRRVDDHTEFVVMTDDPPYIGNRYVLQEGMIPVFEKGEAAFTPLYSDPHGQWISAYAPIRNSEAKIVGLLELDYSVAEFQTESRKHLNRIITFSIISFLVASIFGVILAQTITKPIRTQVDGMVHVIQTDKLDVNSVPASNIKELNKLSGTFTILINSLADSRAKVVATQSLAMLKLAELAEKRDPETGEHLIRMAHYAKALARRLGQMDKYRHFLTDAWIWQLFEAAPLHDIGKVGIEDRILLKPGGLDEEEFQIMKTHALIGEEILQGPDFFQVAREVAGGHHEKWDGSGYPQGLKGEAIPISARIIAVGDVYDALTSKRVYKEAFSHETAKQIIVEGAGTHFDPEIVQAFQDIEDEFIAIKDEHQDA